MNNLRLLAGPLCVVLLSCGVCCYGRSVITLEELFEAAELNSTQLRPSFTAEKEAEREISVARTGYLPDISASLSVSYIGDGFTTKRDFSDYSKAPIPHLGTGLSLNVNQPLYTGGAITGSVELAKLKCDAAKYETELKRDNIRFSITGFYLDIYKYTNLRKVVKSNLESARTVLSEMRERFEQGTVLRNDITRYELLQSNLELELVRINNNIDILNDNLVTLAELPEDCVVEPDSTILLRALPACGEEWWQQEAEFNSPAVGLARTGVGISRKAESIVRSEFVPKIGIRAGWTIDGPILVEVPPVNRNLSYWYVGVGISYNISSLYKNNKSLSRSTIATRKAIESFEATKENVSLSVRADHVRYLEAYEELKTRQKGVELAERNYNVISTRYAEGMAIITDMLDAADSRLEAEQQLVNARINILYYYYKLLFTTGKI